MTTIEENSLRYEKLKEMIEKGFVLKSTTSQSYPFGIYTPMGGLMACGLTIDDTIDRAAEVLLVNYGNVMKGVHNG